MASYNGARHLREQLESIASQTCLPDELVVCDDCSMDETLDILESFSKNALFPVRIHQNPENLGYAQNFAKAIRLCQGDIVFFCDQDDIWFPGKIEKILEVFSGNHDVGYVFSDATLVDDELVPFGSLWAHIGFSGARYGSYVNGNQLDAILGGGPFVYGNAMAFRSCFRDLILPILSTPEITHDSWVSILLSAVGNRGIAFPEELLAYRQHVRQAVGAGRKNTIREKWRRAKQDRRSVFLGKATGLRSLSDRIRALPGIDVFQLDQCIAHMEARASLQALANWRRLPIIFAELNSGRYSRFSSSWKSAFKDLLFT